MQTQAQTGPAAVGGPAAGEVNAPRLPKKDRIIYLAASRRADGYTKVIVHYVVCPTSECPVEVSAEELDDYTGDEDVEMFEKCIKEIHYYIPSQRNPIRLKAREYRRWYSKKYREAWLNAVEQYIRDVAKIIEFAAAHAPAPEAAEALRRFDVRVVVEPPDGAVAAVGLKVGERVIPLGMPYDSASVSAVLVDVGGTMWGRAVDEYEYERIRAMVFTHMWPAVVRKVAGCTVEYRLNGSAKIVCNSDSIEVENVMPAASVIEAAGP